MNRNLGLFDLEDDSPPAFRAIEVGVSNDVGVSDEVGVSEEVDVSEEEEEQYHSLDSGNADIDDSFLQAAIHDEGNEEIFQSDIQKALALSLEFSDQNSISRNTDTEVSKKPDVRGKSIPFVSRDTNNVTFDSPFRVPSTERKNLTRSEFDSDFTPRDSELTSICVKKESAKMNTDDSQGYSEEVKMLIKRGLLPSAAKQDNAISVRDDHKGISDIMPPPLSRKESEEMSFESGVPLYHLELLDEDRQEYQAVLSDFQQAGLTVYRIERLHNKYLHDKYRSEQDRMKKLRPRGFDLNERYLYHGTSAPKDRICEEGLDARLSRMGSFGRGIYFSDNPSKCIQYTGHEKEWEHILICRVILGDSKIYPPKAIDPDLIREPEKEKGSSGDRRYYDSVTGEPIDFKEFVVYENSRSMIDYIITYKVGQSTASAGIHLKPAENQRMTVAEGINIEHMETIERVRENIRRQRCLEDGLVYKEPSQEELERDRKKWNNILLASNKEYQSTEEDEAINEILNTLITDFLQVTQSEDRIKARQIIIDSNMDLNTAVEKYYSTF